jgi:hypothetical protein
VDKVCFCIDRTGEVTALLPDVPEHHSFMTCYAHVGQHSSCDTRWVREETRAATPEEYAPLLRELEQIYGTMEIVSIQECLK